MHPDESIKNMNIHIFIKGEHMASILSVPLPDDLKKEMDKHSEIKWVEVARQAMWNKIIVLKKMDEMLANSELTEEDVEKHSRIVKKKAWEKHKKEWKL